MSLRGTLKLAAAVAATSLVFGFQGAADGRAEAVRAITANSLRGHVSFLASDLLEGRGTPSRGLDLAAEYIASQFRRAGLEPAGDDGYFQTANWVTREPNFDGFHLTLSHGELSVVVPPERAALLMREAGEVSEAPLVKVRLSDSAALAALRDRDVPGSVLFVEFTLREREQLAKLVEELRPVFTLALDRSGFTTRFLREPQLVDPANPRPRMLADSIAVRDETAAKIFDALETGVPAGKVTARWSKPADKPVRLRNVTGLLRGSDPVLRETAIVVSAHYDHLGVRPQVKGDNIFNGANDDASGTASVVEIAAALAAMAEKPRRSIVFAAFFGEERGLLGSQHYVRNPVFPLEKTVANINLEHLGRTDATEGPQAGRATLTGMDYTDMAAVFEEAGKAAGIEFYKHPKNNDTFFASSDNLAFAQAGIPAHTICAAFIFPDYHQAGDHWDKLDYANMEKVDRAIALGLLALANRAEAPKWNAENPRTERFRKK